MSRPRRVALNSPAAVQQRCEENLGLIYHVANRLAPRYHRPADDLVAYGYIGLHRAAEMFDKAQGFAFSTYAVPKITGAIMDGVRSEAPWSERLERDRCAYQRVERDAELEGDTVSVEEAAERLGWPVERVLRARRLLLPVPGEPTWLGELVEAGNETL